MPLAGVTVTVVSLALAGALPLEPSAVPCASVTLPPSALSLSLSVTPQLLSKNTADKRITVSAFGRI